MESRRRLVGLGGSIALSMLYLLLRGDVFNRYPKDVELGEVKAKAKVCKIFVRG